MHCIGAKIQSFAVGHPSPAEPADPPELRDDHVPGQAQQQLLRLLHGRRIKGHKSILNAFFQEGYSLNVILGPLWSPGWEWC